MDDNRITEGVLWKGIMRFFFPIFLGSLFMTLYNTVDAMIVGRFLGKEALAAVGGTGILVTLTIGFFTGTAEGTAVVMSQAHGGGDRQAEGRCIRSSIFLGLVFSVIVTIGGLLATDSLLVLVKIPEDIISISSSYLHIYFLGSTAMILFNMASGLFRAMGDSVRPLWFLIAGSVLNIVLDILFISVFHMGVEGAAWATVASQAVAAAITLFSLQRRRGREAADTGRGPDMNTMKRMLYIGLPGGAQAVIYNVANTILHAKVNVFGTDTVAAFSAYGKLDLIFWMLVSAFGISASTFSGQNWGAGKKERARKGMWECFAICLALSILTVIFYLTFGERCYGFFTDDPAVIEIGMRILRTIAPCFVLYIPIEIISGGFRGTGKTVIPTLITLFGTCAIRVAWLMTPYGSSTIERVSLCCGISWTVGSILFFVYYAIDRPFGKKGGRKEITL